MMMNFTKLLMKNVVFDSMNMVVACHFFSPQYYNITQVIGGFLVL